MTPAEARRVINRVLGDEGYVGVGDHAVRELAADELDMGDVLNILRCGDVRRAEWENGEWRYRVETQRMVVVIAFSEDGPPTIFVVTAWRLRPQ